MTEQADRRADATRLQILLAASHAFARKPYFQVSLDDILAQARVTKGAMYFHFRSKHELALAIIDRQNAAGHDLLTEVQSRRLSGLETLIDMSCLVVTRDIGEDVGRAGLNLLESIGRADGVQSRVLGEWTKTFAEVVRRAVTEGDVLDDRDPDDVGRLLISMFIGMRQTTDINDPQRYFADLQKAWAFTLPGFADPERIGYLNQFIRRRTGLAATKAKPLDPR
ncbi:TetR/AcrR family transcriptional regulator [Mycolicibacterium moriokaense]|nr:TetR/AcrR family transcriptional regulator [Mycolicibacterium moriokaense]